MILFALFILLPMADVFFLFFVAEIIGGWVNTLILVITTGIIGAGLAKHQGLMVIKAVQRELSEGKMPTDHLLSGILVLIGAVLLLTPGVITDAIGFLLMIPGNRKFIIPILKKNISARVKITGIHGGFSVNNQFSDAKVINENDNE